MMKLTKLYSYCRCLSCCLILAFAQHTLAWAQAYLSKDEALDLVLGMDASHIYDAQVLTPELITDLKGRGLWSPDFQEAHFFIGKKQDKVSGYALIDNEIGKHLPITYIVGISPGGKVTRVEVMVFREVRGSEVKDPRFTGQFSGRDAGDGLNIGGEIRHISGATMSSKAIAKGVRRSLYLWQHFYGKEAIQE